MRVAIKGAGAVGSGVGAALQRAGMDVTLIARPAHVDAIARQGGLILREGQAETLIPLRASRELDFTPGLLMIATQAQDVRQACIDVRSHAAGVPTVMLQNGISTDEVAGAVLGRGQIVGCTVRFGNIFLAPGRTETATRAFLLLGNPFDGDTALASRVAALLKPAIDVEVTENLPGAKWTKLLFSLQTPVTAATGLPYSELGRYAGVVRIAVAMVQEALAVAEKLHVRLEALPGSYRARGGKALHGTSLGALGAVKRIRLDAEPFLVPPEALPALFVDRVVSVSPTNSMLESRRRGRRTEIDYINGDVARYGSRAGVPTPFNSRMVDLVHTLERESRYITPSELVSRFERTG